VLERELEAKLGAADPELAAYLASRPAESVRTVQALLHRVLQAAEEKSVPPSSALARELLEEAPAPPPEPRRATGARSSGVVGAGAGATRSREKMVWEWPDVADRVIEEWR
jgi:hypothetical protein